VIKRSECVHTRRTTRRAQVLKAHAVVIGALLSALARLMHRRCRQRRLAAGLACIRRVSPRAHTIAHTIAHPGTCSARMHARASRCLHPQRRAYAHSTYLTRSWSDTHLCAHAHIHMHTARQTASLTGMGYHRKDTHGHTRMNMHSCRTGDDDS
jgi:hypothetical protein